MKDGQIKNKKTKKNTIRSINWVFANVYKQRNVLRNGYKLIVNIVGNFHMDICFVKKTLLLEENF